MFRRLARLAFWVALVAVIVLALAPNKLNISILNTADKAQHLFAFFALAVLGAASWGRRSAIALGLGLTILGGAIEILQATPLIGRDAEFMDWVADIAGILLALVPTALTPSSHSN